MLILVNLLYGCGQEQEYAQPLSTEQKIEEFINKLDQYNELLLYVTSLPYHLQLELDELEGLKVTTSYALNESVPKSYSAKDISNSSSIIKCMKGLNINYIGYFDANDSFGDVPMVVFKSNEFEYYYINSDCDLVADGLYGSGVAFYICDNWYLIYPTPV